MVYRASPAIQKPLAKVAGWGLHFSAGLIFTAIYAELLKRNLLKSDLPDAVVLGLVNGVAAVVIWKATFSLHPDPPQIHFGDFYKHLILAHVVFSTSDLSTLDENQ